MGPGGMTDIRDPVNVERCDWWEEGLYLRSCQLRIKRGCWGERSLCGDMGNNSRFANIKRLVAFLYLMSVAGIQRPRWEIGISVLKPCSMRQCSHNASPIVLPSLWFYTQYRQGAGETLGRVITIAHITQTPDIYRRYRRPPSASGHSATVI